MGFSRIATDITDAMPVTGLCVLFVLLVVLISLAGLHLYTRYVERRTSAQNNEVVSTVFSAISLIYSLVLAFVFLAVWENYKDLDKTIADETDRLNSIVSHSATLPDRIRQPIETALMAYCNQVIDTEWSLEGATVAETASAIPALRMLLLRSEPHSRVEENIYAVLDEDLSCISDLHRNRLSYSESHVPALVWFILNAGSSLLIVFYYFLNIPSPGRKRVYLGFLASYIAMCMFLVYTLDRPFAGKAKLSTQPYRNVLTVLKQNDAISKQAYAINQNQLKP